MVLIPPYIEIDGLVVPLDACVPFKDEPGGVRVRSDPDRPLLGPLMYVTSCLMGRLDAEQALALLAERKKLPLSDGLASCPITEDFDDSGNSAKNWERLTGQPPDLHDAYYVCTTFLRDDLAIPRTTFIKFLTRLYELDAAVAEGRMEAKLDNSILIPAPLPEPPGPPTPRWEDDEVREVEKSAVGLDRIDPLTDAMTDPDTDEAAAKRRPTVFWLLEIAWQRTRDGEDDLPARYRQLGLPLLQAYARATDELVAYLHDPERIEITRKLPPHSPFHSDVSVDLFRHPEPPRPPEYSRHVWLAHAEAAFVYSRKIGNWSGGDMFARIGRHPVRLRYRFEIRPITQLWRVELSAWPPEAPTDRTVVIEARQRRRAAPAPDLPPVTEFRAFINVDGLVLPVREVEKLAAGLDQIDPLTDAMTDPDVDAVVAARRPTAFRFLEVAWQRTRDDLPALGRELGLPTLQAYVRATDELVAYLHDPERIAITRNLPQHSPFLADVSVDLFRHPEPARPLEYSRHVWLAHAEAAFVHSRKTDDRAGGDMFTRIGRYTVRLRYRLEVGHLTHLWRVELA